MKSGLLTISQLEPFDRALSDRPQVIIDNGGYLFALLVGNEIVGVCALFKQCDAVHELTRTAVSPAHQGNGYGDQLLQACLMQPRTVNASKVYLLSNTKLSAAIHLYKKYGFVITAEQQHPVYSRANIVMELAL